MHTPPPSTSKDIPVGREVITGSPSEGERSKSKGEGFIPSDDGASGQGPREIDFSKRRCEVLQSEEIESDSSGDEEVRGIEKHARDMEELQKLLSKSEIKTVKSQAVSKEAIKVSPSMPKARKETPEEILQRVGSAEASYSGGLVAELGESYEQRSSAEMLSLESMASLPDFGQVIEERGAFGVKREMEVEETGEEHGVKRPFIAPTEEFTKIQRVLERKDSGKVYGVLDSFMLRLFSKSTVTYESATQHTDQETRVLLAASKLLDSHEACLDICQYRDEFNWSFVHILSFVGWSETMGFILEKVDWFIEDLGGKSRLLNDQMYYCKETALMLAAEMGFVDCVKLLVMRKASLDVVDRNGENFIFKLVKYACNKNDVRPVRDYFERYASLGTNEGGIVNLLNAANYDGAPVLSVAAKLTSESKKEIVGLLLVNGSDPMDLSRKSGDSLVHLILGGRHIQLFEDLLAFYENKDEGMQALCKLLNNKNMSGVTPYVLIKGRVESESLSIKSLIKYIICLMPTERAMR